LSVQRRCQVVVVLGSAPLVVCLLQLLRMGINNRCLFAAAFAIGNKQSLYRRNDAAMAQHCSSDAAQSPAIYTHKFIIPQLGKNTQWRKRTILKLLPFDTMVQYRYRDCW
jgi:hypothetical protein